MKKLKLFSAAIAILLVFSIFFTSQPMQVLAAETGQNIQLSKLYLLRYNGGRRALFL